MTMEMQLLLNSLTVVPVLYHLLTYSALQSSSFLNQESLFCGMEPWYETVE